MINPLAVLTLLLCTILFCNCRGTGSRVSGDFNETAILPSKNLTLVVWNVQKKKGDVLRNDLMTIIKDEDPDLILTQEAHDKLPDVPGMGSVFGYDWKYPWPGGSYIGMCTYSKAKPDSILSHSTRWREFGITVPKLILETKMALPNGESLLVLNVHSFNFEKSSILKFSEQLKGILPTLSAHKGPVILAGDFNTWSQQRQDHLRAFADKFDLVEVTEFSDDLKTGDLKYSFINQFFGIDPDLPLDRVFLRGLKAREAHVLPYDSSDHRPLLVELKFK